MKCIIVPAETKERRIVWFQECLDKFKLELDEKGMNREDVQIGFPYGIGCGLAGGDWTVYSKMISDWEKEIKCQVVVYKFT
jgi:hypothetical protein